MIYEPFLSFRSRQSRNHTNYDQLLNEGLQTYMQEYFKGAVDKDTALSNFYKYVKETYPEIVVPE